MTSEPSPHAPCPPDQSLRRIHTGLNPLCPHGVPIWVGGGDRRQPTAAPGKGVGPEHPREVRTQRGLAEDAVSQGQWRQGPPPVLGSTALQEEDQSGAVGAGGSGVGGRDAAAWNLSTGWGEGGGGPEGADQVHTLW